MFERYTERAKRAIYFARHEASQIGGDSIEPEHLLLGLLRELPAEVSSRLHISIERVRSEVQSHALLRDGVSIEAGAAVRPRRGGPSEPREHRDRAPAARRAPGIRFCGRRDPRPAGGAGRRRFGRRSPSNAAAGRPDSGPARRPLLAEFSRDLTQAGRRGRPRSADRTPGGAGAGDPGPLPPHQEQPGPHRGTGDRENGHRGRAVEPHRQRRVPDLPRRAADRVARHLAGGRRHQVPGASSRSVSRPSSRSSRSPRTTSSSWTSSTPWSAPAPPRARSTPPTS